MQECDAHVDGIEKLLLIVVLSWEMEGNMCMKEDWQCGPDKNTHKKSQ